MGTGQFLPDALRKNLSRDDKTAEKICVDIGDAIVLKVDLEDGRAVQFTIWKGLTSGYEFFYTKRPSGDVIIADHFRNLLVQLPLADRTISEGAIADHFLFRTVPGTESHCQDVSRVALGECLEFNLNKGSICRHQFDRVDVESEKASSEDYVDWADTALKAVIEPLKSETEVASLFSGGVDSTLIHTYLGNSNPAVYVQSSSTAEGFEAQYATQAINLLGVRLECKKFDTSSFLDDLAGSIRRSALPPMFFNSTTYQAAWKTPYRKMVTGLHADILYGHGSVSTRLASPFASVIGNLILRAASPILNMSPRLNAIQPAAQKLRQHPLDPFGFAGQDSIRSDLGTVMRALGPDLVKARLERRLEYTLERTPQPSASLGRFYQHLELAHSVGSFCEDALMRMRHAASVYGTAVAGPFFSKSLLSAAARVPPQDRYLKGLQGKYLLKQLLINRLPAYPVNQRKGQSTLPFEEFYATGPLSHVWERYEMPEWFREIGPDGKERLSQGVAQSAVAWAVWRNEVLRSPDLQPVPGVQIVTWQI
jgi:asparagine synthetase B (glutamine-hydrolysing)